MIAEHLTNLIMQLRRPRPVPLVLWFIDRPAMFYELLKAREPQGEYMITYTDHELTFYGIPVRQFSPQCATKEELEAHPPFCSRPGMWVEMKDGKHLRLVDDFT